MGGQVETSRNNYLKKKQQQQQTIPNKNNINSYINLAYFLVGLNNVCHFDGYSRVNMVKEA